MIDLAFSVYWLQKTKMAMAKNAELEASKPQTTNKGGINII